MATIREIVNKIRTAILGKDVREAIASGIEKCYEDASTGRMTIPDGSINNEKLANGAVTNDKIAAGAITSDKIADGEAVKMVSYGDHVITDNNNRISYPDISTIVKTEIANETSANDQYPPTSGAVKRYLQSNAFGSMSSGYGGRARITLNGVTNYVPTMSSAEPSGKINKDVLPLATSESAGAMSAADKTKLDTINLEDLENISSISIETNDRESDPTSYYAVLTINGSAYRVPLLGADHKMVTGNLPIVTDITNANAANTNKPATTLAIRNYVNGTASGDPGSRKLVLNLNGTEYSIPILLSTGKVGGALITTADTVTQTGGLPVNGKAVYDYIAGLDIGAPTDAQVDTAVTNWMQDNISDYISHDVDFDSLAGYIVLHTFPDEPEMDTVLYAPLLETPNSKIASKYIPIDDTLTQTGIPADSKKVGDELNDLKSEISTKTGLSAEVKQALMNCFNYVAWKNNDPNASQYISALQSALYPPANLTSISAVYTQSGAVYETDSLDSLKSDLVVTANYSDSTTETVSTYTLSGTLTEGTSVITVSYGGKTTTFNVTVSETLSIVFQSGYTRSNVNGKLEASSSRSASSIIPNGSKLAQHNVSCTVDGLATNIILRIYDENGICDNSAGFASQQTVPVNVSAFSVILQMALNSETVVLTIDDQPYTATIGTVQEYSNTVPVNVSIQSLDATTGETVENAARVLTDFIPVVPITVADTGVVRFNLTAPSGIFIKLFEYTDSSFLSSKTLGSLATNSLSGNVDATCTKVRILFKKNSNTDFTSSEIEALTLSNYGLVTYEFTEV